MEEFLIFLLLPLWVGVRGCKFEFEVSISLKEDGRGIEEFDSFLLSFFGGVGVASLRFLVSISRSKSSSFLIPSLLVS